MENKELFKRLEQLGFPLFEIDEALNPNETIAEVVKSKNTRLWEGFPIIFANSNKEHIFNFETTKKSLDDKEDYNSFIQLILMSFSLYKFLNLKFSWEKNLLKNADLKDKNKINEFMSYFTSNKEFQLSHKYLDSQRIKKLFDNYFMLEDSALKKIDNVHDELSLEYALSQLFTPKQKEIFLKRLQGKKLTKTEREYFYRVIKKKAMALTNDDLQRLAQQVIR
ncbi:MAG: hypothetical protein ABII75_04150 [Candidatus Omnitrophota bacterium]